MKERVRALLSKISYIETDMELQKQILSSIPSNQTEEMETMVARIAEMKQQIIDLRRQIQETDQEEFNRIVAMEQAAERFKSLAKEKKFVQIHSTDDQGLCAITLNDGSRLECLVTAQDESGNWTVLTLDGQIKEYPGGLVKG
jgi:PIN domain nuclease of toxin-antitoxin system